jgi:hypothetical protein
MFGTLRINVGRNVCCDIAAGVLIVAALAKLAATHTLPHVSVWQMGAAAGEVFLASWLLSRWKPRAAARVAAGLFALFAAFAAWRLRTGVQRCSCFGDIRIHPAVMLSLTAATACGVLCELRRNIGRFRFLRLASIMVASVAIGMGLRSAFASQDAAHGFWVQTVHLIEAKARLNDHVRILVVQHNCPHCLRILAQVRNMEPSANGERLIIAELEPFSTPGERSQIFPINCQVIQLMGWFPPCVPADIRVVEGTMVSVQCI